MPIILRKQFIKANRKESVPCWIAKDVSAMLDSISEETGLSKQCVTDYILRRACEMVQIVDCDECR